MHGFLGRRWIVFNQDGGQGGGQGAGGAQGNQGGGQQQGQQQQGGNGNGQNGQQQGNQGGGQQQDFQADYMRFVAAKGNGDTSLAGFMLWQDNYQERQRNRQLQDQLTQTQQQLQQLQSAALTDEQRQAWQAYQQLGPVDQLQQRLTEFQTLQRNAQLAEVAAVAGYNAEAVVALDKLAGGLVFDFREATANGQKIREAIVKVKDTNNVEQVIPLHEYVQQRHAALLPALTAQGGQQGQGGQQQQQQGAGWVKQNAGNQGGGQGGTLVEQHMRRQEELRKKELEQNPLVAKK